MMDKAAGTAESRDEAEEGSRGVTKPPSMTVEGVANTISALAARATKALREVSDAIAELREAEKVLKGLAASQTIAPENREPTNSATFAHLIPERLAYPIPELARKLGVNRKTIERRIADKTFKTVNMPGRRLVTAESVRAMFETGE
jgi:hypothetical protein